MQISDNLLNVVKGWISISSKVFTAPLLLVASTVYLNAFDQGVFLISFTIAASQQLLDAGFGFCILRSFDKFRTNQDQDSLKTKANLTKVILAWYVGTGIILFFVVLFLGFFLVDEKITNSSIFDVVWLSFSFLLSVQYVLCFAPNYLEAEGDVRSAFSIRLFNNFISPILISLGLVCGLGLYSILFNPITALVANIIAIAKIHDSIKSSLMFKSFEWKYIYFFWRENKEILMVWSTGYFYWNSIPLVLFYFFGPVVSGSYQITFAISSAFNQLSQQFVRVLYMSFLRDFNEGRNFNAVSKKFHREFFRGLYLFIILTIIFLISINFTRFNFVDRLLVGPELYLCFFIGFFVYINGSIADFTRLFGGDPFFAMSLTGNILTPIALFGLGYFFHNLAFLLIVFLFIQLVTFMWTRIIYTELFNEA